MKTDIQKAVVLGAGTMGAQVAAHVVAQGLEVALLDVAGAAEDRSAAARKGREALRKLKPSPLHLPEHGAQLRVGNFEDDLARELKDADWVFEAVVEDLEIKKQLFAKVASLVKPAAIVSSNTSGLGIAKMSAPLPAAFRQRFLGTHFFNPPRYLKLLETIPGPETLPEVLAAVEDFADRVLGKGVVRCKDTPNFIANRIGSFGFGAALKAMTDLDLTVEEVDALTGPALGRAKSATFRTADLAGVDVAVKVAENLYAAVETDPQRELYQVPAFMKEMVKRGLLGEKTGAGFYKKVGADIFTLDWKSLEYRPRQKPKFAALDAAANNPDPLARLAQVMAGQDRAAQFLWRVLAGTALYAAAMLPEIADDPLAVDRAMEWGYGWGSGPFRLLDGLGVKHVAENAARTGVTVPVLLESLLASGRPSFYLKEGVGETLFGPAGVKPVPVRSGVVDLARVKANGGLRKKNAGASLLDLGDGCALVEFHSKMNSLGQDSFAMLQTAVKEAKAHFDAIVIGNQGPNFSAGANLMLVLLAVQEQEWDDLGLSIRQFQNANLALKYADVPVVAAPFGLTLGGGCEISLHCDRVQLSAETYMGLVEVGVGVIPGGGGTKELALRAHDRCAGVEGAEAFPFIKRAFELIAFAKVSSSGQEAKRSLLTAADGISANPDRQIEDAKQLALGLHRAGYRPGRPRTDIPVLGTPALATFKMGIYNARAGGQISEHDALVAQKVANVLCGGDRSPGAASEQHFLDLEREAFLSLLGTKKTQERVAYM
ncbi:MAG TPA: 3-hydroxyacyl-CoA dehydrogenase/enoyl-CoA hydratase family protein, partial [Vicinamibacteria bacterium]